MEKYMIKIKRTLTYENNYLKVILESFYQRLYFIKIAQYVIIKLINC